MNLNLNRQELVRRVVPPVVAVILLVSFTSLGLWQLDRAAFKKQLAASFVSDSVYTRVLGEMQVETFRPIKSDGRYLGDRQIFIDNIVKDGRLGMYVITPLEYSADEPLLLVNRGWVPRQGQAGTLPDISVADERLEVTGKAGNLPRVGIRPGEAFEGSHSWPRVSVYPDIDEVATELGRDVLSFVLLLDPDPSANMVRQWQPVQSGPATHYGYAFQWFAMAATVLGISLWNVRKRLGRGSDHA
jgi:surfeit locus 1 family protein